MKIVYIGKFQKLWDEECIARSFEALGHSVLRIEERQIDKEERKEAEEKEENEGLKRLTRLQWILNKIDEFAPDLVLWAKLDTDFDRLGFQDEIKKRKITTACWIFDIYLDYPNRDFLVPYQPLFRADFVFTTDGGHDEEWIKRNVNHFVLRQGIYDKEAIIGNKTNTAVEIIFVGSNNKDFPERNKMLSLIEKKYENRFHWYGKNNTDEVRSLKLNDLFASTKITIGDSFPSPYYWSNRIYETIGRGGFLLFPFTKGIDKEFIPYEHFIPYERINIERLFKIIDYYLVHEKEREKIKIAGFNHCKKNYTYQKRCEKLLSIVNG